MMGEAGVRLVLQRLAPSQDNLGRLAELIAANERDERCEFPETPDRTAYTLTDLVRYSSGALLQIYRPVR